LFWEKIGYFILLCKFEKEASKKGKNCQSFETTKIEKNKIKSLVQTLPIKDIFHFLSLNNETVEIQYELMVGFKVVSYFKLIILCWIFYLCSKDYQDGFC